MYRAQNDLESAERAFRRSLEIWTKLLGQDSRRTAVVSSNLAEVLTAARRYEEAQTLFERSIAAFERTRTVESPEFAKVLEQFAQLLRERTNDEARMIEDRAKAIRTVLRYTVAESF